MTNTSPPQTARRLWVRILLGVLAFALGGAAALGLYLVVGFASSPLLWVYAFVYGWYTAGVVLAGILLTVVIKTRRNSKAWNELWVSFFCGLSVVVVAGIVATMLGAL
ncbi:hypothetical protein [Mycobacteroides salmoniphilum]|uniref:hypothetical protein n=1 Tax=Mycobacteroides salmoniphilum TaxID=404941 RepID=UPI001066E544|nr:hypothetical protein [Mycobacteroides salmoniphilum]TDZ97974.1 hypothetical protein CCUG62472_01003 [Mycobacteroides salmoniphilum]